MKIDLSPEARRAMASSGPSGASEPQIQARSLTGGAVPNPDGTVTTVGDVVVVGQKRTLFTVRISIPEPPPPLPLQDELAPPPDDQPLILPLTPCQQETLKDRAALEAQKILDGLDRRKEWGMYLIRDPDGSIRGVGPVEGQNANGVEGIPWNATVVELGISSWSQLVGLVHTHPVDNNADSDAYNLSPQDRNVTQTFIGAGADIDFRQYISVCADLMQFSNNHQSGRVSNDKVTGEGCV